MTLANLAMPISAQPAPPRRVSAQILRYVPGPNRVGAIGRRGVAEGPDGERIRLGQALMARIADGDQAAFTSLVAEATPRLLRFARSLLSETPAESEEIVQEALFRLWRAADEWRPEGKI